MSLSYAQVEEVLRIIEEFPVAEIRFEYQDLKLYVRRAGVDGQQAAEPLRTAQAEPRQVLQQTETDRPQQAQVASDKKSKTKKAVAAKRNGWLPVSAPMMGVFYRAPAPGAEPFVEVGQKVSAGTDLCILEVMKVMNLIKAPCSGVVAEISAENASMVELEQVLMWIRP